MGFGGSVPQMDAAQQDEIMQSRMERERLYRSQDAEEAKIARLEEEKLRLSLERAYRQAEEEELKMEQQEIARKESAAIQESQSQSQSAGMAMAKTFGDRPSVQIPNRSS